MSDWVVSDIIGEDSHVSSIAPNHPAPGVAEVVQPQPQANQSPNQSMPVSNEKADDESITQLGSSYRINDVTVKKAGKGMPSWLLTAIIVTPIVLIFLMSALSNKESKKEESFLFKTLESKYFTMNFSPDYEATSVVDKKVPFLEKHDLISKTNGEKNFSLTIKEVKFDYSLDNNSLVRANRESTDKYSEEPYKLKYKEGLYFKKKTDNFEHTALIVDRSKSILYEISFSSPSGLYNDENLTKEMESFMDSLTFL